jgi:hypothetical protein
MRLMIGQSSFVEFCQIITHTKIHFVADPSCEFLTQFIWVKTHTEYLLISINLRKICDPTNGVLRSLLYLLISVNESVNNYKIFTVSTTNGTLSLSINFKRKGN